MGDVCHETNKRSPSSPSSPAPTNTTTTISISHDDDSAETEWRLPASLAPTPSRTTV